MGNTFGVFFHFHLIMLREGGGDFGVCLLGTKSIKNCDSEVETSRTVLGNSAHCPSVGCLLYMDHLYKSYTCSPMLESPAGGKMNCNTGIVICGFPYRNIPVSLCLR